MFAEYFVLQQKRRIKSEQIIEAIDQIMFDVPPEINFASVYRADVRSNHIARKKKSGTRTEGKFIAGLIVWFLSANLSYFFIIIIILLYVYYYFIIILFFSLFSFVSRLFFTIGRVDSSSTIEGFSNNIGYYFREKKKKKRTCILQRL